MPSTRTVIAVAESRGGGPPAASASVSVESRARRGRASAARARRVRCMSGQPLSTRVYVGVRSAQVSWLPGRSSAPSRPAVASQWLRRLAARAADFPGHSGGSAPVLHRLPLPPTNDGAIVALCDTATSVAMTVNLTRIYTKRGDGGETDLGDRSRVSKADPRIEAYGEVDELGAHIGFALTLARPAAAHGGVAAPHPERPLRRRRRPRGAGGGPARAPAASCPSRSSGSSSAATRSTRRSRRCARSCSPAARRRRPGCTSAARCAGARSGASSRSATAASPETLRYLNRLSDLLFILAREANDGEEPLWVPGQNR